MLPYLILLFWWAREKWYMCLCLCVSFVPLLWATFFFEASFIAISRTTQYFGLKFLNIFLKKQNKIILWRFFLIFLNSHSQAPYKGSSILEWKRSWVPVSQSPWGYGMSLQQSSGQWGRGEQWRANGKSRSHHKQNKIWSLFKNKCGHNTFSSHILVDWSQSDGHKTELYRRIIFHHYLFASLMYENYSGKMIALASTIIQKVYYLNVLW